MAVNGFRIKINIKTEIILVGNKRNQKEKSKKRIKAFA
jgi:hypothetical protein